MKFGPICLISLLCPGFLISCGPGENKSGSDAEFEIQINEKIKNAKKGDVVEIPEGKFEIENTLVLDNVPFITIRGAAQSKSVLSFRNLPEGAVGIKISNANDIVIENLSIHDTRGNAIQGDNSRNITIQNVAIGWSADPGTVVNRSGIYLSACKNILVEKCAITAASEAGVLIEQSENSIIRENIVYENSAGIEIRNGLYTDISNNKTYNNATGIFVVDFPGLAVKNGHHTRVFKNIIKENNHTNFSGNKNSMTGIASGTGMYVLGAREVEIFNNEFSGHQLTGAAVLSYSFINSSTNDSLYNPYASAVFIHHNIFTQENAMPDTSSALGKLAAGIFNGNNPHILYDGFMDPAYIEKNGKVRESRDLCLRNNGDIKFANINAPSGYKEIKTDPNVHDCEQGELPPVEL